MDKKNQAWEDLISALTQQGILRSPKIISAFKAVPRWKFVTDGLIDHAADDIPLPIGYGQTISQPLTVAIMLEALQPKTGEQCLDVGAGSGWVSALLSTLVGPTGKVLGFERIPQLTRVAQNRLRIEALTNVTIESGDASHGWSADAPYDIIHVAAAARSVPAEMKEQLVIGGRLIIPVGEPVQDLALITKIEDNKFSDRRIPGFQFVPLINNQTDPT